MAGWGAGKICRMGLPETPDAVGELKCWLQSFGLLLHLFIFGAALRRYDIIIYPLRSRFPHLDSG